MHHKRRGVSIGLEQIKAYAETTSAVSYTALDVNNFLIMIKYVYVYWMQDLQNRHQMYKSQRRLLHSIDNRDNHLCPPNASY